MDTQHRNETKQDIKSKMMTLKKTVSWLEMSTLVLTKYTVYILTHEFHAHTFTYTHMYTHMYTHTDTQETVLSDWSIVSCAGEGWWLQTAVKALRTRGWHPLSSEWGEMSKTGDLSLSLPSSLSLSLFFNIFSFSCSSSFVFEDSVNNSLTSVCHPTLWLLATFFAGSVHMLSILIYLFCKKKLYPY